MTEETPEKWLQGDPNKLSINVSPSSSSFEALDPHDPNLSCLATTLFEKTSDYLHGELTATNDHYILLQRINELAITKYADLRQITVNLNKTVDDYNVMYESTIQPLLEQIDVIEQQVSKLEVCANNLDNYTKQLKARFSNLS